MNPDVAKAIPDLVHRGILSEEKGFAALRIARGELVSVHLVDTTFMSRRPGCY